MKRLALLLGCAAFLCAAPATVTVSQILYKADGTPYRGSVFISWQQFDTGAGEHIPAGTKQVNLSPMGLLTVALVPNVGAVPSGTAYTVVYKLDLGDSKRVAWIVPASGPVTVTAIESTTLVGPSSIVALTQLGSGGAANGQCPVWSSTSGTWVPATCGADSSVTTISGSGPSWLTWTITNPTSTPVISLAPTTGQTSHQVIGTCGGATTFTPCALVAADLPATVVTAVTNDTNVTGSISGQNLTLGWAGVLAAARLNSNVVQAITNDTNITGSITAQNLTLAWSGTLAAARMVNAGVHTGDCTTTFPACTISAGAIGLSKMATLAANSTICNNTGSAATPIACSIAQMQALLSVPTGTGTGVFTGQSNAWTTGTQDWSAVTHTLPEKVGTIAGKPATCTVGEKYFATDATAGQNDFFCTATNTWTQQLNSGGGAVSVFTGSTATNPAFSATPTFSLADISVKSPVRFEPGAITANVTAVTFTNKTAGAKFSIAWTQNGTGGFTVAYGASVGGTAACQIDPTASATTTQDFEVGADGTTVNGVGCHTSTSAITLSEQSAPGTPASTYFTCWGDSTDHAGWECKANNSANVFKMVLTGVDINPVTGQVTATHLSSALPVNQGGTGITAFGTGVATALGTNVSGTGAFCLASGSACAGGGSGGGVNAQTISYTLVSGDAGKLVTMNGSSLTASLYATPGSTYAVGIKNLNVSDLIVSRNGLQINGGTSNITLKQYQSTTCFADATPNYWCDPPVIAGTNITLTPASNGFTLSLATISGDCTLSGSVITCTQLNGSNFTVSTAGIPTKVDGITTTGTGVPIIGWKSNVTNQSSNQAVTLATSPTAGDYEIHYVVDMNTPCTTGSNSVSFAFSWTDASNARTLGTGSLNFGTAQTTGSFMNGIIPIHVGSGNVAYTSTMNGTCASGTSTYDINAWMVRVN